MYGVCQTCGRAVETAGEAAVPAVRNLRGETLAKAAKTAATAAYAVGGGRLRHSA